MNQNTIQSGIHRLAEDIGIPEDEEPVWREAFEELGWIPNIERHRMEQNNEQ